LADQHPNGHTMTGLPRPDAVGDLAMQVLAGDLLLETRGAKLAAGVAVTAEPMVEVAATLPGVTEAFADAPTATAVATEAALVACEVNGQG